MSQESNWNTIKENKVRIQISGRPYFIENMLYNLIFGSWKEKENFEKRDLGLDVLRSKMVNFEHWEPADFFLFFCVGWDPGPINQNEPGSYDQEKTSKILHT